MKAQTLLIVTAVLVGAAAPSFGAACTSFSVGPTLTLAGFIAASGGSCTVDNGAVTFSNFQVSGSYGSSAATSTINLTFTDLGNILVGVNFVAPNNGTTNPFSVSYDATPTAGNSLTGYNDSASPANLGNYTFTIGGNTYPGCGTVTGGGCTGGLNSTVLTTNGVTYAPTPGSANQSTTLDFSVSQISAPEPASFALIGGALVALGLVARGRKRTAQPPPDQQEAQQ